MVPLPLTSKPSRTQITGPIVTASLLVTIVIFTIWTYLTVGNFEFVNWDDPWYVTQNSLIQSWTWENTRTILTESVNRNYAPLTLFSLAIDYSLWGDWAGGYHLVNLGMHLVNSVLVFFLIRRLADRQDVAFFTAACFAIHPVQIESVAWVSSRKGLVSATFILASFYCWLREDRTPRHEVWGIVWFILGLLSKAIAIVLPAVVLLYDVIVRRQKIQDALPRQIIPGFLALWFLLRTMTAQFMVLGGVRDHMALSKLEILGVDSIILWKYVGMLLAPQDLCVLYHQPLEGIAWSILISTFAWCVVSWTLWKLRNHSRHLGFAFLCWLVLLLPVLNLFPITTLMNDRYLYLPMIPFFAAFWGSVFWLGGKLAPIDRARFVQYPIICVSLTFVAFLFLSSRSYLPVWRNDRSLWAHANRHVPELAVVQIQWALSHKNAGEDEKALQILEDALTGDFVDHHDRKRMQEKIEAWSQEQAMVNPR